MIQKTKVLTLIVFGLLFINLSAQEDSFSNDKVAKLPDGNRTYRFGLQFNPNITWLKVNTADYGSEGSKVGFGYGLSFEYFMTSNYLFSTGVFLSNVGGKFSYVGVYGNDVGTYQANVEANYKMKYIEIPLLMKLRSNEIGYLTYFGKFGLKTGFNYGASTELEYGYTVGNTASQKQEKIKDASDHINWINLALVIGGGVEYNISGNTSLSFGVTYNNGFINQLDTKVMELDGSGNVLFDSDGNPLLLDEKASANLNYVALNIGIYF